MIHHRAGGRDKGALASWFIARGIRLLLGRGGSAIIAAGGAAALLSQTVAAVVWFGCVYGCLRAAAVSRRPFGTPRNGRGS